MAEIGVWGRMMKREGEIGHQTWLERREGKHYDSPTGP